MLENVGECHKVFDGDMNVYINNKNELEMKSVIMQ